MESKGDVLVFGDERIPRDWMTEEEQSNFDHLKMVLAEMQPMLMRYRQAELLRDHFVGLLKASLGARKGGTAGGVDEPVPDPHA